jgi:outer membrane immunogenic protein
VPPLTIRTSFKTHYFVTVAPRLGYAWGHALPYVTGGLAIGDLDFSQSLHDLTNPANRLGGERTQTNAGWMIGGGLQYAFSKHWSARMQYQYVDLGHASFDARLTNTSVFRSHHEASLTEHNASFAIIYQF